MVHAAAQTGPETRSKLARFFGVTGQGVKAPWRVFWVALVVRLLYMTLAHTWRVRTGQEHFGFGFEAGRIARSLVNGFGYADPFATFWMPHTGPTAWLPPAYPLLMAAVFKLFGVYSALSAWVLLAINCVLSAWTAMAVWELGARFAGLRNGRWAGWLWALHPAAMQYAVKWLWEMSLTTALFAWVLVLAFRMRAEPGRSPLRRWAWFGLAWGGIALSNSTLLLFLPACGLWILLGTAGAERRRALAGAALGGLLCLASIAPWALRNERVFGHFIPLRGNFGAELDLGNGPHAEGLLMEYNHPFQAADQLKLYSQLGEVEYVQRRGAEARATIARDPGLFARNTLKRIYFFWWSVPQPQQRQQGVEVGRVLNFGFISLAGLLGLALALRRGVPGAWLFFWAMVLLPLTYYFVTVHARFRHPLEPILCVLGVYLFQAAGPRVQAGRPRDLRLRPLRADPRPVAGTQVH